jgi:hypothetical protein
MSRADLAAQVGGLQVVSRCACGDHSCAHLYTESPPAGSYGEGHTKASLPAKSGLVVLGLVDGRIAAVKVLDRAVARSCLALSRVCGVFNPVAHRALGSCEIPGIGRGLDANDLCAPARTVDLQNSD